MSKYIIIGLLVDVLLIGAGLIVCVLVVVVGSDGKCPNFFSFIGSADCTALHYAAGAIILMAVTVFRWWWMILPALLIPPVVAYCVGRSNLP
jgi:hypothetical protein